MKLFRVILCCTLLLAAIPSFAFPCSFCNDNDECEDSPMSQTRCLPIINGCETRRAPSCNPFTDATQSKLPEWNIDWSIASIEVSRPDTGTTTVAASTAVAQIEASQPTALK